MSTLDARDQALGDAAHFPLRVGGLDVSASSRQCQLAGLSIGQLKLLEALALDFLQRVPAGARDPGTRTLGEPLIDVQAGGQAVGGRP